MWHSFRMLCFILTIGSVAAEQSDSVETPHAPFGYLWMGSELIIWDGHHGWALDPQKNTWRQLAANLNTGRRVDVAELVKVDNRSFVAGYILEKKVRIDRYSMDTNKWSSVREFAIGGLDFAGETPYVRIVASTRIEKGTLFFVEVNNDKEPLCGVRVLDDGTADLVSKKDAPMRCIYNCRSGCFAYHADGKVFVWGYGPVSRNVGAIWDARTDTWTAMDGGRAPRYDFAHCFTGTEVIVFGGARSSAFGRIVKENMAYSPMKDQWRELPKENTPTPRRGALTCWAGDRAFVCGGRGGEEEVMLSSGGVFIPKTGKWESVATEGAPSGRTDAACVWTGKEVLIWDGGRNDGAAYNPQTNTWRALPKISTKE